MSIINSQPLIGASGNQSTAYNLTRSLRFRSSATALLTRTPTSLGSTTTWTWSAWVKRGVLGTRQGLFVSTNAAGNDYVGLEFLANDKLALIANDNSSPERLRLETNAVFRDPSAWYHIVVFFNTTNATSSNRAAIYVNGVLQTYSTATYMPQNYNGRINTTNQHNISSWSPAANLYFDGYLAETNFIDGQALEPSSFGETDTATGVWKPKKYTGTYGTNGFYLKFDNLTSTSTLGNDSSGNSNTWTVNNISLTSGSTYDSMKDVPTLTDADTANYAVLNPVAYNSSTISDGNLLFAGSSGTNARATFAMPSSGSFYWEVTPTTTMPNYIGFGLLIDTCSSTATAGSGATGLWGLYPGGTLYTSINSTITNTSITTPALGCTFAVAYDCATGKAWFGYAASGAGSITWIEGGSPSAGTSPTTTISTTSLLFAFLSSNDTTSNKSAINFGQRPFAYTPPSGFKALNTFNLPTPTIGATASTQAGKYFNPVLYTGNASGASVTGVGFQPDFVWMKSRGGVRNHELLDAVRGGSSTLFSNLTNAEATDQRISAFGSDGFTYTTNSNSANAGEAFVAWNWKANGAGSSNTTGTISSTVSANTTAGFSIATYTGNGTGGATFGHGLGVAPSMVIVKNRTDAGSQWIVFHTTLGGTKFVYLDGTDAAQTASGAWNNTAPSSTLVTLGTSSYVNGSTKNYVAYCFAEVAGYSKFGSYTGNGSTDGPFVFTGFRPKFVLIKDTTGSTNYWNIVDTTRNTYNVMDLNLYPNRSDAEGTSTTLDALSNGFKIRTTGTNTNTNGNTYIYMALAETPFKYSLGR